MTPQRHVRDWLHNHNTSAIELSKMLRRADSYVATFLCPSGGNPVAIKVIDKIVDFPDEFLQAAVKKLNLLNKKRRRQIDKDAQGLRNELIMAWKAPKEVV